MINPAKPIILTPKNTADATPRARRCDLSPSDLTCSTHLITRLIRNIEPAPTQCVAPSTTPTQTETVPHIGSAAYHIYMDDIILTFDTPVTLADDWHENISIYAETESGTIQLDGLDAGTRNLMSDGSHMVWLSLAYDDARQLNDVTNMTLRISPGTVTYGDNDALWTPLLPRVTVVP